MAMAEARLQTKGWFRSADAQQRRALAAASLGWMLDSMDVMIYAMVLPAVQREMHLSSALSGAMMSATLIAAAVGGIYFGWFADRMGRTRALNASMLLYSIATMLCGFTHTALTLAACRILLGLGMGGEWASGAALVAESFPAAHRAKALAFVQSFWAIGYALGALLTAVLMPRFGWRAVFFAGVIPAVLTLWIRHSVREGAEFVRDRQASPSPMQLFRGPLARGTLVCSTMNAATLFAWWGLFTWTPRFLSLPESAGGHGLSIVNTSTWTIVMQVGTFLEAYVHRLPADRSGRCSCLRRGAQHVAASDHRAGCGLLWHGILLRLQRHCKRALPDAPARYRDGLRLQHRAHRECGCAVCHRSACGEAWPRCSPLDYLCRVCRGCAHRDRAQVFCAANSRFRARTDLNAEVSTH
jgi:MFS family permease